MNRKEGVQTMTASAAGNSRATLISELLRELTRRERLVLALRYTEELTITDRGEPIARLVPAGWPRRLRELEDAGLVTMPTAPKRAIAGERLPHAVGPQPWSVNDIRDEWR